MRSIGVSGRRDKLIPAHPPKWAIQAIHARGYGTASGRSKEISGPVLRADGTILAAEGYDPGTGLLCSAAVNVAAIADMPTCRDIRNAIETLTDSVADFPFENEAHRAVWFVFFSRSWADLRSQGVPPYSSWTPTPPARQRSALRSRGHYRHWPQDSRMASPRDDDEARKRITSLALSGDMLILVDNIRGGFGGPALEAAMTGTEWRDRILGRSEIVTLPLMATWCGTGNNIILQGDMPRRVAHIRLLTPLERPEEREGFCTPT